MRPVFFLWMEYIVVLKYHDLQTIHDINTITFIYHNKTTVLLKTYKQDSAAVDINLPIGVQWRPAIRGGPHVKKTIKKIIN